MNLLTRILAVDVPKNTQLASWELSLRGLPTLCGYLLSQRPT